MISPRKGVAQIRVQRVREGASRTRKDAVAVEEPMEIRIELPVGSGVDVHAVSVTMRTPGHDFELAVGFLFTEGLVKTREDVQEIRYCSGDDPQEYNIVAVRLAEGVPFDPGRLMRNFYTTSSCGVCGKASLEAIEVKGCVPFTEDDLSVEAALLPRLPERLREGQGLFERTGGLHAAALFAPDGALIEVREDVGRHNAVDKVIGHEILEGRVPVSDRILMVSSRTSFEILQKALVAGIPMVVAVGAPSSLAVHLANQFNITLVGFTHSDGFNVYSGAKRIRGLTG